MKRLNHNSTAEMGCIVTFSNGISRHFWGFDSLQDAVEYADRKELKIRTISTPRTIYIDLQEGSRRKKDSDTRRSEGFVSFPEVSILSKIKRNDLYAGSK